MRVVLVPNELRDEIYKRVDTAIEKNPQFKDQRESIYKEILEYFDWHGTIPDFSLEHRNPSDKEVRSE